MSEPVIILFDTFSDGCYHYVPGSERALQENAHIRIEPEVDHEKILQNGRKCRRGIRSEDP